jgi:hypothetical protein
MISYLDSELFYLVFLDWLIGICVLNSVALFLGYKNRKVSTWIMVNRFLLISSTAVFILISIPYLFLDIFDVPLFNIILSNVYSLLLVICAVLYEYTIIKRDTNSMKKSHVKEEGNL